jgi:hypothetical protein
LLSGTMAFKGLLEWKILAAIFAVLIVGSSAFLGNTDIGGTLLNSTGGGSAGWENPFASLFPQQQPETASGPSEVAIELSVDSIRLDFASPVNITFGDSAIENFAGSAQLDLSSNSSVFTQAGTGMTMRIADDVVINGAGIESMVLESADYTVTNGGTSTTATGEKIEIHGFSGTVRAAGKLRLEGTVSSVSNGKWSIG